MKTYSQAGQDIFISYLIGNTNKQKFFIDIGCSLPNTINNTLLLEENGWNGISLDILNLNKEWEIRKTKFIQADALNIDYKQLLNDNKFPKVIDYLNVDIEGNGYRYIALKNIIDTDNEFKIITVEHDAYRGYETTEREPQRKLLTEKGYVLVGSNITLSNNPFEDWWINPKYISKNKYEHLICDTVDYSYIINKISLK